MNEYIEALEDLRHKIGCSKDLASEALVKIAFLSNKFDALLEEEQLVLEAKRLVNNDKAND